MIASMKFISLVSRLGKEAQTIGKEALQATGPVVSAAALIDPALAPLGALVSGISRSVLAAAPSAASNEGKKSAVLEAVEAMSPALLELLADKLGHGVVDEARFAAGVDGAIEGILNIAKSFGAVPTSTAAPAAPPSK
jgi:hypothetical protein